MFLEALTWLTTPAPDWARKAGYLQELIAIQARHRRWSVEWMPHLEASRSIVEQAILQCDRRRHAIVYGSGLLLDIPLETLADAFETVTLMDAAHLRQTKRKVRRFDNVRCVEADISGVAIGLLLGAGKGADRLPPPKSPSVEAPDRVDFVVSANLLTQLPVIPLRFLKQRLNFPSETLDDYARAIMQAHIDHLAGLKAVCCLIAEVQTDHIAPDGELLESHDPLRGVILPTADQTWHWTVAPRGEISAAYAVHNYVAAAICMPQCSDNAAIRQGASP